MGPEEFSPPAHEQLPNFYQAVLGVPLTPEQLNDKHNIVVVDDIDAALRMAETYDGCEIWSTKNRVFADQFCAVMKCPDGTLLILVETVKANKH